VYLCHYLEGLDYPISGRGELSYYSEGLDFFFPVPERVGLTHYLERLDYFTIWKGKTLPLSGRFGLFHYLGVELSQNLKGFVYLTTWIAWTNPQVGKGRLSVP
jgi:hypothetical protein